MGKRYFGIFLDPVLACNFRCKMCYFSDDKKRSEMKGILKFDDIEKIAASLFHRALKLQIGCGAEPTLDKNLVEIVKLGKRYHIPFISITSNGFLITKDILEKLGQAGLDELTLSMHGTTKSTYESLMTNGDFERFTSLLADFAEVRKIYPDMNLRINYTMNSDNVEELAYMPELLKKTSLSTLQIRPIQQIGESEYSDFSIDKIAGCYDSVIMPLIKFCKDNNITIIAPSKENLTSLKDDKDNDTRIEDATYFYISPKNCWRKDYDYEKYRFEEFCKKNNIASKLFKSAFASKSGRKSITKKMNYKIK